MFTHVHTRCSSREARLVAFSPSPESPTPPPAAEKPSEPARDPDREVKDQIRRHLEEQDRKADRKKVEAEDRTSAKKNLDDPRVWKQAVREVEIENWLAKAGIPTGMKVEVEIDDAGKERVRLVTECGDVPIRTSLRHDFLHRDDNPETAKKTILTEARAQASKAGLIVDKPETGGNARTKEVRQWLADAGIPSGVQVTVEELTTPVSGLALLQGPNGLSFGEKVTLTTNSGPQAFAFQAGLPKERFVEEARQFAIGKKLIATKKQRKSFTDAITRSYDD